MARRSALRRARVRASEADRNLVAERLYDATLEGRLLTEELDHRLGVALSARTYGELEPLVADLPGSRPRPPHDSRAPVRGWAALMLTVLIAGLGLLLWHRW
jgi:Domain of unknown function (DUF1707)